MVNRVINKLEGDRWVWLMVIILSLWTMLEVYRSVGTLAYKNGMASEVYLVKHVSMIIGGFALMYFSHLLDYRYYAGISKILIIVTIPILLYTLIFGDSINDAIRWVTIPVINQTFQTSAL